MEYFEETFGRPLVRYLPLLAASMGALTLAIVTVIFYTDHCSEVDYEPVDHQQISDYMCCEPSKAIGFAGLTITGLLLLAASVPIRDRFVSSIVDSAESGYCRVGAQLQIVILFTALGLIGLGVVNICADAEVHNIFAFDFFIAGLVLMWFYNAPFVWSGGHDHGAPGLVKLVQNRILRLACCTVVSITNFYWGEPLEWLMTEWVTVIVYFFVLGVVMQVDILYPPLLYAGGPESKDEENSPLVATTGGQDPEPEEPPSPAVPTTAEQTEEGKKKKKKKKSIFRRFSLR